MRAHGRVALVAGGGERNVLYAATGQMLEGLVGELVFGPAGMTTAGFAQPVAGEAAIGGWHTYPEQAAAGMPPAPETPT
jgi:CubicO group peptidase (beta-lactamase class C family)